MLSAMGLGYGRGLDPPPSSTLPQDQVEKEDLLSTLQCEFINRVNEVGVDVNRALAHPYTQSLVQYICGLGSRKGSHLLKVSQGSPPKHPHLHYHHHQHHHYHHHHHHHHPHHHHHHHHHQPHRQPQKIKFNVFFIKFYFIFISIIFI